MSNSAYIPIGAFNSPVNIVLNAIIFTYLFSGRQSGFFESIRKARDRVWSRISGADPPASTGSQETFAHIIPLRPMRCFYDTPLCRFFLILNIASFAWNFRRKPHRAFWTQLKFFFFKTVNSMKVQTHLSHFDAKMFFLKLILHMFQINITPFYFRILQRHCFLRTYEEKFWENPSLKFFVNSAFSWFFLNF